MLIATGIINVLLGLTLFMLLGTLIINSRVGKTNRFLTWVVALLLMVEYMVSGSAAMGGSLTAVDVYDFWTQLLFVLSSRVTVIILAWIVIIRQYIITWR